MLATWLHSAEALAVPPRSWIATSACESASGVARMSEIEGVGDLSFVGSDPTRPNFALAFCTNPFRRVTTSCFSRQHLGRDAWSWTWEFQCDGANSLLFSAAQPHGRWRRGRSSRRCRWWDILMPKPRRHLPTRLLRSARA